MFKRKIVLCMMMVIMGMTCIGCSIDKRTDDKVSDIDYTIVTESEIPQTLMTSIEERKNAPFRLSYSDNEELYIAVGYGEQQSGGYGIVVDELYLTENTIVFATTLEGPEETTEITGNPTYPYIVVKTEFIDKEVIYK